VSVNLPLLYFEAQLLPDLSLHLEGRTEVRVQVGSVHLDGRVKVVLVNLDLLGIFVVLKWVEYVALLLQILVQVEDIVGLLNRAGLHLDI
jgi:hypothetical protein